MQPSTLPRTLLFVGLLTLAAVTVAPSASALAWMTAGPTYRLVYYSEGGIGIWYEFDPESGQTTAKACLFTHDSYYPPLPVWTQPDGDAGWGVWVVAGLDSSDGSTKASTACFTAPPDAPDSPGLPIPGAVQAYL